MNSKEFMVVMMPRESHLEPEFNHFGAYDEAFEAFNEKIAAEGEQLFKMPARQPPLRAALQDGFLELWVCNRTDELVK